MKRYIVIVSGLLFLNSILLHAQNEIDALRYSQTFSQGTARSLGLGGATGALGGEFGSLGVNPAGIGLYRSSEMSFSPALSWNITSSDFLNEKYSDESYKLGLGNMGFVFNYDMNREKGWVSTSFGFGYNRLNNFNREIYMRGTQNNSSYLDNFVHYAEDLDPEDLDPYYEGLAWETYMIDLDSQSGEYFNDFADGGYGQIQERSVSSRGSVGEYLFTFGANYSHRLYLGASFGINAVRYEQNIIHFENDPNDIINFTRSFRFDEYFYTRGVGYNMKIGAIGRPLDFLRIGASFHLPTFYNLKDEFENSMEAYIDADNLDPAEGIENPMTASSGLGDYRYNLRTPAKIIGSGVVTIGKMGLISMDYEFINYRKADLSASDYNFMEENQDIEAVYRSTHNFRLGGELKLGAIYFRGGYAYYASPFATEEYDINSDRNILSAGFGLRSRFFFFDFAYSHANTEESYYLYVPGLLDPAVNSHNSNTVQATIGFRF